MKRAERAIVALILVAAMSAFGRLGWRRYREVGRRKREREREAFVAGVRREAVQETVSAMEAVAASAGMLASPVYPMVNCPDCHFRFRSQRSIHGAPVKVSCPSCEHILVLARV